MRELLRNRRFMTFWLGQAVSTVGDGMAPVAAAALALIYHGPTGLGVLLATGSVGYGATLLLGGVIADRFSRTAVMAGGDVLRLGGALALLFLFGQAPLAVVCAFAGLTGVGMALFQPAYRAVFVQLLPVEQLRRANALQAIVSRGAHALGAALAGLLVATVGGRVAYAVDAATFVASIATLAAIRLPPVPRDATAGTGVSGVLRDARAGLEAVWRVPWAAVVMGQGTLQVLAGFAPVVVLLPAVATQRYGDGAYGLLAAGQGIGAIIGAAVVLRLRPRYEGLTAMHGVAAFAPVCLCLAAPVPLWLFLLAQLAGWAGIGVFAGFWFPALQREFPADLQGRVFSLEALATFAMQPIGLALTPWLAEAVGVAAFGVGTAVLIVVTSYAVFVVRGVSTFGAAPAVPGAGPVAAGPVAVTPLG